MNNQFKVISKLWPSGTPLEGGLDENPVSPTGPPFVRTAAPLAPGPGAPNGYRFLFWNTGRRVTSKYKVTWAFNHLSTWTTWTATRWYGVISGPNGPPGPDPMLITTTAFAIEDDASMPGTPIDAPPASTFVNGPNGELAWPFGSPADDSVASTQWGAASVAALDPFPPQLVFNQYLFAGWLHLVLGGEAIGQFDETDGPAVGGGSFYSELTPSPFPVDQGHSADLMAAYRVVPMTLPGVPERYPIEFITFIEWLLDYDRRVDPRSPGGDFDRIRSLADLFAVTRMGAAPEHLLESLAANARSMSPADLERALTSVNAITRRAGETAESLEAALSKRRKGGTG